MTPTTSSLFSSSTSLQLSTNEIKMEYGDGEDASMKTKGSTKKSFKDIGSAKKTKGKVSPGKFEKSCSKRSPSVTKTTPGKLPVKKPERQNYEFSTSESEPEETEVTFEDYSELCERVAKTMYYANSRPPTTPRPSLPLTILAVDTFSKFARKDTLEFLDIDMAAEIGRNACVSPTALVFALVYLERLSLNNPGYLKTVKPSELFVVSLLVASKFVQDDGEDLGIFNDEWATSSNMEQKKINKLELEFLTAIDWHINIGKDEYERALKRIEERMALDQGSKRGWFTYTELKTLTSTHITQNAILSILYQRIVEVVSGICIMYTTFFATLITSSVLAPYLLSVSKLVLVSTVTNSLMTGSSLSSCTEDLTNASIPMSQDLNNIHVQTPLSNIPGYVPDGQLLASLEEEENKTESGNLIWNNFANSWRQQQVNNVVLHHHKGYETDSVNSGYSFKCESNYCQQYSPDEALQNVQRVLENLLHPSNRMSTNHIKNQKHHFESDICITNGACPN